MNASRATCFLVLLLLAGCASSGIRIDELRTRAATGSAQAQLQLGQAYEEGRGVARDQAEAA